MRTPNTSQTVSDIEQEARLAEGRKTNAEGEVLTLSAAKKTLESDIKELEIKKSSLTQDNEIMSANSEVYKKNKDDARVSFEEYVQKIEKDKKALADSVIQEQAGLDKAVLEKKVVSDSLVELYAKEINLKNDIRGMEVDLTNHSDRYTECISQIRQATVDLEKVNEDIKVKTEVLQPLQDEERALKNSVSVLEHSVLAKKDELSAVEKDLALKHNEVISVSRDIESAKQAVADELKKVYEIKATADERTNIATLAEKRVQDKTEYLLKLVEKAKVDNLISDFKI